VSFSANGRPRVVITGMGVVTPLGSDLDAFWSALLRGASGVRRITQFDPSGLPCQIAGEIPDFDPTAYMSAKEARRTARLSHLALAAAEKAVADSCLGLPGPEPERVGVCFGTAIGGMGHAVDGITTLRNLGIERTSPFYLPSAMWNTPAFFITRRFGALGRNITLSTSCATGTQVVGEAADAIRSGKAEVMIATAAEAMIRDFILAGFALMRALPTNYNQAPERASRPFDARREGFILSEGAACLILESYEHACARGARIYAEVAGYASSGDAFHIATPDPTAAGATRTMQWALQDAGITPDSIGYINAHGTSTPANDATETLAIKQLFGEQAYNIPISSTKSMLGHAMGASGAIEAVVCALTLARQMVHPTINLEEPDSECDLDYVPNQARPAAVEAALSNSFGLGGQNACLVLRRISEPCAAT
jgi:beta-ketoacyl-acyl-carrier-protein synthase II